MAEYAFVREDGEAIGVADKKPEDGKVQESASKPKSTNIGINLNCDPGALLVEDCQSFEGISGKEFSKRTASNLSTLFKRLFDIKKEQEAKHGPDGEILEYTKSRYMVELPDSVVVLPREKPCPKEKTKTKWEKFMLERGMTPRKRRSRLVFDPITKDWVPRWGKGSIKKIEDEHQWLHPEKPKHVESGMDPYTYAKAEKKQKFEKQKLAEVKNKVHAMAPKAMRDVKILG